MPRPGKPRPYHRLGVSLRKSAAVPSEEEYTGEGTHRCPPIASHREGARI